MHQFINSPTSINLIYVHPRSCFQLNMSQIQYFCSYLSHFFYSCDKVMQQKKINGEQGMTVRVITTW